MSRVFIINSSAHDYSSATKFGKVCNITEGKVPLFKTDLMKSILIKELNNFTSEDYLLVSGPTWLCMMTAIILSKRLTEIKFLVFDAKEQEYIVRHFKL
jgi:hypothetical protein